MTAASDQTAGRWATLGLVGGVVDERIRVLQEGVRKNLSSSVAALARLRRGVGKKPGSVNDILQYTLDDRLAPQGAGDDPTPAETAAHIALTLYAVHQQSLSEPMHRRGYGLGRSIRGLHPGELDNAAKPVLRRFQALGTADSLDELVHHARGMVQLLRNNQIPLDYGLLADQLARWQCPGGPEPVRLSWGRDFYRTQTATPPTTDSQ